MTFTITPKAAIEGTSLLKAIKSSNCRIKEVFGKLPTGLRQKYSNHLIVTHGDTGEVFTIYTCFGEWRVGGRSEACTRIGELLELIEPERYSGFGLLSAEEIMANPLRAA